MSTNEFRTIKIQDMQMGHRYCEVRPGFDTYVVVDVTTKDANWETLRDGEWVTPKIVTVTYNHGTQLVHEFDTDIAVDWDEVVA